MIVTAIIKIIIGVSYLSTHGRYSQILWEDMLAETERQGPKRLKFQGQYDIKVLSVIILLGVIRPYDCSIRVFDIIEQQCSEDTLSLHVATFMTDLFRGNKTS